MPPDSSRADVEAFLAKAKKDLLTAQTMSEQPEDFADVVCFHAQQCGEKALKAMLVLNGLDVPRTHDLESLAEALRAVSPVVADFHSECALLSDFGVSPRYPGWEPVVGAIDVSEVLAAARRLLEWAAARASDTADPPAGAGGPSPPA